jgi:hypothetical protein
MDWNGMDWNGLERNGRSGSHKQPNQGNDMKNNIVYSYKSPQAMAVPAQTAGEEIERIEKKEGIVSPQKIVEYSTPEDAPMHRVFEWDDEVAGGKFRVVQARQLLRQLVCVYTEEKKEPAHYTRAFVNVVVNQGENRGYVSIYTAIKIPNLMNQVVRNAMVELQNFTRKYREVQALSRIVSIIDDEIHELNKS